MMTSSITSSAERFLFVSGRVSLDFAHTGGENERKQFERLHIPADLARWFAECSLRLPTVAVNKTDMARASRLREAVWHLAQAVRLQTALAAHHVRTLNQTAAVAPPTPGLTLTGDKVLRPVGAQSALSLIARDAIDLFGCTPAVRITECANPVCHLLFVDTSRGRKRRWCAMQRCGTMTKVALFRSKQN